MNVFATLGTRGFARVRHPGYVFAQLIIFRLSKCQTKTHLTHNKGGVMPQQMIAKNGGILTL